MNRERLREDIQERLDCVRDELKEWAFETETHAYLDGQIYVLEILLSDIDSGLWEEKL